MNILRILLFIALGTFITGCASDFNRAEIVGQTYPRDRWIDLETRAFKSVRYDSYSQQLRLVFNSGTVHSYEHFPESEFNRFLVAGGKWGFYKANIRDAYPVQATYTAKKPGSFSVVHRASWSDPGRVFYSEVKPERPIEE